MHYWNQPKFETLDEIAQALEQDRQLAGLADYCIYHNRGMRARTQEALDGFLAFAKTWDDDVARTACDHLLQINARSPTAHWFLTHDLLDRFVFPVLDSWLVEDPSASLPLRWLGLLRQDKTLLNSALQANSEDVPVRQLLVCMHLLDVDRASRLLVEEESSGNLQVIRRALNDARGLIERKGIAEPFKGPVRSIEHYEQLLEDWEEYSVSPQTTFREWCLTRGRYYR